MGRSTGATLPGARLRLRFRQGPDWLSLQANKNRPQARTRLEIESHVVQAGIAISRSRTVWVGADAFAFDPTLRTAALGPPAPFAGSAEFRRSASPSKRWGGDLSVDLPGRSDVPLTGPGVEATLARACRHEGESRFRC